MSAPDTRRPADYESEARTLVEWLFAQAALIRKHAPDRRFDIAKLEDSAALIDSFRAGLVLVNPHPLMRAELVRWVSVDDALPDADETVLICGPGDDSPWPGYLDSPHWRSADGFYLNPHRVTHWAPMPTGPAVPAAGVVTPSENGPEVAQ